MVIMYQIPEFCFMVFCSKIYQYLQVIFVDADQIVRADMGELYDMDLKGKPLAYTPFCDNNKEMDGYRFWRQVITIVELRFIYLLFIISFQAPCTVGVHHTHEDTTWRAKSFFMLFLSNRVSGRII